MGTKDVALRRWPRIVMEKDSIKPASSVSLV